MNGVSGVTTGLRQPCGTIHTLGKQKQNKHEGKSMTCICDCGESHLCFSAIPLGQKSAKPYHSRVRMRSP